MAGGVWRPVVGDELRDLHGRLQRAFEELAAFRGALPEGLSSMSAFALGEAVGTISKAKAQVGRDIDERDGKAGP